MNDFFDSELKGYLDLDLSDPNAGDVARKWRVYCRERDRMAVVVARAGRKATIHINDTRATPGPWMYGNEVLEHPSVPRPRRLLAGRDVISFPLLAHRLAAVVATEQRISVSLGSADRVAAHRRGPIQGEPLSTSDGVVCHAGTVTGVPMQAPPAVDLDEREYRVVDCALAHAFSGLPGPLKLCSMVGGFWEMQLWHDPNLWENLRLEDRLGEPELVTSWRDSLGPYRLEDRFNLPGGIRLCEDEPCLVDVTRPGFDSSGRRALVHLTGNRPRFLICQLGELGWSVQSESFDADWSTYDWEQDEEFDPFEWTPSDQTPIMRDWRASPVTFPGTPASLFRKLSEWGENHRLYHDLCHNQGPRELLDAEILPTLNAGKHLSVRQYTMLTRECGELVWDLGATPLTEALRRHRLTVVDANQPWVRKLLAHLAELYPVTQASADWVLPEPIPPGGHAPLLEAMGRILTAAGLPSREMHLVETAPLALIQTQPGLPVRLVKASPGALERPGTLFLSNRLFQLQRGGLFALVGATLKYADPDGHWTDRVWHHCGVVAEEFGEDWAFV